MLFFSFPSKFSISQTKMTHFLFHSLPHRFSHCLSRQFSFLWFYSLNLFCLLSSALSKNILLMLALLLKLGGLLLSLLPDATSTQQRIYWEYTRGITLTSFLNAFPNSCKLPEILRGKVTRTTWCDKKKICFQNALYKKDYKLFLLKGF